MQIAQGDAVLGDFSDVKLAIDGVETRFVTRGDRYYVITRGSNGTAQDYEIKWTFGVHPLQQYIVELAGGRLQALTVAWDSRSQREGGQRWFSLTPGHGMQPGDPLHWTGREYNWNYSCADCHSTAVRKNYDAATDRFRTEFKEINVSCESCHGAGSAHANWGSYPSVLRRVVGSGNGLTARLTERHGVSWRVDSASGIPYRTAPRESDREIEVCAQCHSRRLHFADGYVAGKNLFDYYVPVTLGDDYYPDGQQRAEDYNYGSFLQSRMYSAGVTCSDCHDPHSARLRKPGNAVCGQCHLSSNYDTGAHHHHIVAGAASACTSCHMPSTTYMEVDARPDHSMRIPRPDLTMALGVPNACNGCHTLKSAEWAAAQIRAWYPAPRARFQRFADEFDADDRNLPGAARGLAKIAGDSTQPWFIRASALGRLARYSDTTSLRTALARSHDPRPLVRLAALQVAEGFGARERLEIGVPMLSDSTLAVRKGAAWLIAPVSDSLRGEENRRRFESAANEFIASQRYNADQPGDRYILGLFLAQLHRLEEAAAEFRGALRLEPRMGAAAAAVAELEALRKVP